MPVFEYLENRNQIDLTGKQQHGFKKNKSTATAGSLLQSIISRAADDNCYDKKMVQDGKFSFFIVQAHFV